MTSVENMRIERVEAYLGPSDVVRLFLGNTNHNSTVGAQITGRRIHLHNPLLHYRGDACNGPVLGFAGGLGRERV
jgi:hypothetical protein